MQFNIDEDDGGEATDLLFISSQDNQSRNMLETKRIPRIQKHQGGVWMTSQATWEWVWCIILLVTCIASVIIGIMGIFFDTFNDKSIITVLKENPTYVTPAAGVFVSMWVITYILSVIMAIYQLMADSDKFMNDKRVMLSVTFILHTLWIPAMAFERWWVMGPLIGAHLVVLGWTYSTMQLRYHRCSNLTWCCQRQETGNKNCCRKMGGVLFVYPAISVTLAWTLILTFVSIGILFRHSGFHVPNLTHPEDTNTFMITLLLGQPPGTAGSLSPTGSVAIIGGNEETGAGVALVCSAFAFLVAFTTNDVWFCATTILTTAGIHITHTRSDNDYFPSAGKSRLVRDYALVAVMVSTVAFIWALVAMLFCPRRNVYTEGKKSKVMTE
jgi:hypothetical protein